MYPLVTRMKMLDFLVMWKKIICDLICVELIHFLDLINCLESLGVFEGLKLV